MGLSVYTEHREEVSCKKSRLLFFWRERLLFSESVGLSVAERKREGWRIGYEEHEALCFTSFITFNFCTSRDEGISVTSHSGTM